MDNFILETERLFLREITTEDAPDMYALNLDPEVIKYTGDPPFESVEAAETFIRNYPDYVKNGFGRWAVIRKADRALLGWCGLKYIADTRETDVGYRFFKKYWGNGYATEAAAASLKFGFETLHFPRIVAQAMYENLASIRIMEKIGMRFWKETECAHEPGVTYKITRTEFEAGKH